MSLINQMLQDLEKRSASSADRGGIAQYVRALPQTHTAIVPRWVIGAAAALSMVVLAAFAAVQFKLWPQFAHRAETIETPARAISSEPTPVRVAATIATPPVPAKPRPELDTAAQPVAHPASRLSLEISPPAAPVAESVPEEPVKPTAPTRSVAIAPKAAERVAIPRSPKTAGAHDKVAAISDRPTTADTSSTSADAAMKHMSPQQRAENEFRRGSALLQQGRGADAQDAFRDALQFNANHDGARQALLGLLIEAHRNADAERLLQDRLNLGASHPGFAAALARLQLDRGDTTAAIETLQRTLPFAAQNADYVALLAAILQRAGRHVEAVEQYHAAVRLAPNAGVWWMGLGISQQALNHVAEAQDAFKRARAGNALTPELQAFVDQRLKQLQ